VLISLVTSQSFALFHYALNLLVSGTLLVYCVSTVYINHDDDSRNVPHPPVERLVCSTFVITFLTYFSEFNVLVAQIFQYKTSKASGGYAEEFINPRI
jgi:hypothetical protein